MPRRSNARGSLRFNESRHATFLPSAFENPFEEGVFRWVARGEYTSGPRMKKACVAKWFKRGTKFSEIYFDEDLKAVDKAAQIIDAFNQEQVVDKHIVLNYPQVWTCSTGESSPRKVLVEPFIENFQKFNSNSGWSDSSHEWAQVMQALSHFSYHFSGEQFVLCDLQGGIYRSSIILTDPVVLSRASRYGVTDLGPKGISNFFKEHVCNQYCSSRWKMPRDQRRHFRPARGTKMIMKHVPTQRLRPQQTLYGK